MTATALSASSHSLATARPVPAGHPADRAGVRRRHLVSLPTGEQVTPAAAPTVRVTRRGRLVLTSAVLGVALATGAVAAWPAGATATPEVVTVTEGQTLGEIARAELPDLPMAEAVSALVVANDLGSAHVHAGQELVIPAA
ncbi:hypothetical protein GCM10027055_13080 [Janibacter alkaliphilus]|uniref:LysM repeat protein n=1 Tax=Janibacter alkaliphilus TaxID=1069963 RepID=A0A852XH14_9MICO|nr:LysM peptidoglycan-binding domain-containing protein [Janibacter alkaliphilus]NYG37701.1 LysM repeat protein [Janibacter alkaliphilus]